MKAWGEVVIPRLDALGLDVRECRTEGERLLFLPDGRLGLAVGSVDLEVALVLPARELAVLHERLANPERALEVASAVESLPEQFAMGAARPGERIPVTRASTDGVRALVEELRREQKPLWLGWSVPLVEALAHAAWLDDLLGDAAVALGSVLALLSWTPASSPAVHGRERSARHKGRGDDDRTTTTKRRARARSRDRDHDREGEVEAEPEAPSAGEPAQPLLHRAAQRSPLRRSGLRTAPAAGVDPKAPIDKGTRVRVLEGPFAGKAGAVQELDGKGGARVLLGLLAVRLDVKDLVACAEGRERPLLSSSHRKPVPARS
jgi:hypothetical protein